MDNSILKDNTTVELVGTKEFTPEGFEIRYLKFQQPSHEDQQETIYGAKLEKYLFGDNKAADQVIEPLTHCSKHIDAILAKMQEHSVNTTDFYSVVDQIYDMTL